LKFSDGEKAETLAIRQQFTTPALNKTRGISRQATLMVAQARQHVDMN
jgi:hypothetical protein